MMLRRTSSGKRPAFSLLEVIVAMAIFLLGMVAISQLITLGGERALDVQQQSQAAQLCQAKMSEVVAGVQPLTSQSEASFDGEDLPDWTWSMDAEQSSITNLWNVKITVSHPRAGGQKLEVSLSQMVLDPAQRGSTLDAVAAASAQSQNSSSSSSSSSSGSSGSSSTGKTPTTPASPVMQPSVNPPKQPPTPPKP